MNSEPFARYYSAVKYLENLNNLAGSYQKTNLAAHPHPEMYLERMQGLLDRIGNPEKSFKYIHITGTAGKGSVSNLIQETLVSKGRRAGLFTSPFVTSTIEKIRVKDRYIDPLVFADIVEWLKPHIDLAARLDRHGLPSYFEIILAIALLYFQREKCEYVVLEVGLGGSYDATNIIKDPLVTAITNISLDHTNILGKTTAEIARDKSGIIKKGSRFFTTEENPDLLAIFQKKCAEVGADYQALEIGRLDHNNRNRLLAGNICTALGLISKPEDLPLSNQNSRLPARFEIVEKEPLVIIDGAHNPSKIAATLANLAKLTYNRLAVIIAVSADKDWENILSQILPKTTSLYLTRFNNPNRNCVNPKSLLEFAQASGFDPRQIHFNLDPLQSFSSAKQSLGTKDALLVTGSFYLAGEIRAIYCPEEQVLRQRNSSLGQNNRVPGSD